MSRRLGHAAVVRRVRARRREARLRRGTPDRRVRAPRAPAAARPTGRSPARVDAGERARRPRRRRDRRSRRARCWPSPTPCAAATRTIGVTALGTARGLEARLVPARGYALARSRAVPLPAGPPRSCCACPAGCAAPSASTGAHLDEVGADVVVGFGGYVAHAGLPGRPAPRHPARGPRGERPRRAWPTGSAPGSRRTSRPPSTGTRLPGARVHRHPAAPRGRDPRPGGHARRGARAAFGLRRHGPVLLVTGGSQGARAAQRRRRPRPRRPARRRRPGAARGRRRSKADRGARRAGRRPPPYADVLAYVDRMELAYAAADLVVCRGGAMTCAELAAVGLPAVYVPLPIGNGEQRSTRAPVVRRRRRPARRRRRARPLTASAPAAPARWRTRPGCTRMGAAAAGFGPRDADEVLADARWWQRPSTWTAGAAMIVPAPPSLPATRWAGSTSSVSAGPACAASPVCCSPGGCPCRGSDAKDVPGPRRAACARCHGARRPRAAHVEGCRHGGRLDGHPRVQPGAAWMPAGAGLRGASPGRGAGRAAWRAGAAVAVAGTHGKTTTTSMLTVALQHCGADPSFAIGGDLNEPGQQRPPRQRRSLRRRGRRERRLVPRLPPYAAIVTNVEADHLDHYGDGRGGGRRRSRTSSRRSTGRVPGRVRRRPGARALAAWARARGVDVRTYGTADDADLRLADLTVERRDEHATSAVLRGRRLGPVQPAVAGAALRAQRAGRAAHRPSGSALPRTARRGARRLHRRTPAPDGAQGHRRRCAGLRRLRPPPDRAAAPSSGGPRAWPGAAAWSRPSSRTCYSRTAAFAEEFGAALALADEVVVMDVYGARALGPARKLALDGPLGAAHPLGDGADVQVLDVAQRQRGALPRCEGS